MVSVTIVTERDRRRRTAIGSLALHLIKIHKAEETIKSVNQTNVDAQTTKASTKAHPPYTFFHSTAIHWDSLIVEKGFTL